MKIAIYHELSYRSGARRVIEGFGEELSKKHEVDLFYIDEKEDKSLKKRFKSINFFEFKEKKWTGRNWKARLYKDSLELLSLFKLNKSISKKINSKKYDFVLVSSSKFTQAPFIIKFLKSKKIYYCHEALRVIYDQVIIDEVDIPFYKKPYEKINNVKRKYIDASNIKSADLIITNSNFTKGNVKKAYGLDSFVCYPGVDTNFFKPLSVKKTIDALYFGIKAKEDGFDLFEQITNFKNKQISIKRIGDNKREMNDFAILNYYNKSKSVLALSKNEPLGLVPLEAMSSGIPVIALNQGGLKETVIDGQTGFLVNEDKNEIIKRIIELKENERLRSTMEDNARKYILNNFSWDKQTKLLLEIIDKHI